MDFFIVLLSMCKFLQSENDFNYSFLLLNSSYISIRAPTQYLLRRVQKPITAALLFKEILSGCRSIRRRLFSSPNAHQMFIRNEVGSKMNSLFITGVIIDRLTVKVFSVNIKYLSVSFIFLARFSIIIYRYRLRVDIIWGT